MSIVVTGAGGFIGGHLVHMLAAAGQQVTAVVRSPLRNLPPGADQLTLDLAAPDWTSDLPTEVEAVFHLAQSRNYRNFPDRAEDIFRINVASVAELLEWARKTGVKRLLLASTGSVYVPSADLLTEDAPCAASSMYAATKLCAEHLAEPYAQFFHVAVCRLFTVYGPGQQDMLVPTLLRRIHAREPIELAGGLGAVLTPIHIADVCAALLQVSAMVTGHAVVNIAGPEVLDVREMALLLGEAVGLAPVFKQTSQEPLRLCGSTGRLQDLAGIVPSIKFRRGAHTLSEASDEQDSAAYSTHRRRA